MRCVAGACLTLLLTASGCSSLTYYRTDELWAESESEFDTGDYSDAIPYYTELIRRDEEDAQAYLLRGVSRERSGKPNGALRDYAKSAKLGEVRALLYRANLNISRGDTSSAEEDLGRLKDMGLSGRDRMIQLTLLGTLRLEQGQARLAAQSLERASQVGSGFRDPSGRRHLADAHYNAAQAYYSLGDFGRAYDHFIAYAGNRSPSPVDEQGLLDGPVTSLSDADYYMLGVLAYLAGDYDAADVHLGRADPSLVSRAAEILDDPSFGATSPRSDGLDFDNLELEPGYGNREGLK